MWGIATLMACWSFSLMVRWVSDWNARRHRRLTPMYSKKAFRLAPLLAFVCITVAVIAGAAANQLASINGDYIGALRSAIGIISLLIIVVGLMWLIRNIVGDRARGQVRCPKCWYDMSDVPGLRCPECGNESKSRTQHTKTHRPRMAIILAFFMIGIGIYGLAANRRVLMYSDPLAAVPSWVLMAGWEWLPTHWIYDDGTVKPDGTPVAANACLQKRLSNIRWISSRRSTRFANRLARPMLDDKEARWDAKRLGLLSNLYSEQYYWQTPDRFRVPTEIDPDELLRMCALDLVEALITDSPDLLDESILDTAHEEAKSAYKLAEHWALWSVAKDEYPQIHSYVYNNPVVDGHIQKVLAPVADEIDRPEIVDLINAVDVYQQTLAISLLIDSGAMKHHYKRLAQKLNPQIGVRGYWEAMYYLAETIRTLPADMQPEAQTMIADWLKSDLVRPRANALRVIYNLIQADSIHPETEPTFDYSGLITLARKQTLDDHRAPFTEYPESTVSQSMTRILIMIDKTGIESFPLIRDQILKHNMPYQGQMPAFYRSALWADESVVAWLDAIGPLAKSPNPLIRIWVLDHFPTRSDSIHEAQLIKITTTMVGDEDEDIEMKARNILWDRGIDLP